MTLPYLAHTVTIDAGTVEQTDEDGALPCVRFLFHAGDVGHGPIHEEVFLDPAAIDSAIEQLQFLKANVHLLTD